ncbi:MAG: DUF2294 domain-containing protein [Rubricoccaceae bacterium]|nr:DUF2294 domain-containing protein [Rubricoccaceae bacterium]
MTRGQIEAAITTAITQFERDHLGRGPREARTFVIQDLVVVRLRGILSPAEQQVSTEPGGAALIKEVRSRLVESARDQLVGFVEAHAGVPVVSMHTDISTRTGERVFVFALAEDLEARLD